MNVSDFEGRAYGPVPWRVTADSVRDFIDLTGDDPNGWTEFAPPGFAAAALFSVAPDLLAELYDRSVIHGEQTFSWNGPLPIGALLDVSGAVTRVRERSGVHFMTFDIEARDRASAAVVTGRSLFLASGEANPGGPPAFVRPEPPHSFRGDPDPAQLSASRADLVRYAAATRDWNPVHWDHEAGVAAGFPGVVVHGLFQAGWALRIATPSAGSHQPFTSARFRFRNPLLPARPVDHTVELHESTVTVVILDEDAEYLTAAIERSDE